MTCRKWDVAWATLDPIVDHEQSGRRPVLIFCNDVIAAPIGVTTVLPLTTLKPGRRVYPTEVLLPAGTVGVAADSLVLTHQIRTVSAKRLSRAFGTLADEAQREQVARALRLWLDLSAP